MNNESKRHICVSCLKISVIHRSPRWRLFYHKEHDLEYKCQNVRVLSEITSVSNKTTLRKIPNRQEKSTSHTSTSTGVRKAGEGTEGRLVRVRAGPRNQPLTDSRDFDSDKTSRTYQRENGRKSRASLMQCAVIHNQTLSFVFLFCFPTIRLLGCVFCRISISVLRWKF